MLVVAIATALFLPAPITTGPNDPIGNPPPRLFYRGFYKKCAYFRGLPIIGSEKVHDRVFHVLIRTFSNMLARVPDSEFQVLVTAGSHYSIIAESEGQTDLPEYAALRNDPRTDWNKRARGLGGFETSGGEENILELPSDRYKGECISISTSSVTRWLTTSSSKPIPRSGRDLRSAFRRARAQGLWDPHLLGHQCGRILGRGRADVFRLRTLGQSPERGPQRGL